MGLELVKSAKAVILNGVRWSRSFRLRKSICSCCLGKLKHCEKKLGICASCTS